MTIKVENLMVGENYYIVYRLGQQKKDRAAIMGFMVRDANVLVFNARPVAGTQTLPISAISRIEFRERTTTRFLNKVVG